MNKGPSQFIEMRKTVKAVKVQAVKVQFHCFRPKSSTLEDPKARVSYKLYQYSKPIQG